MDPYKILGIERDATQEQVRKAYRAKAAKYHPDSGGDAWIFQQIQDAYAQLTGTPGKPTDSTSGNDARSNPHAAFPNEAFWVSDEPEFDHERSAKQISVLALGLGAMLPFVLGGALWWWFAAADFATVGSSETPIVNPEPVLDETSLDSNNKSGPPTPPESSQKWVFDEPTLPKLAEPRDRNGSQTAATPTLPKHPSLLLTFENDNESTNMLWDSSSQAYVGANRGAVYSEGVVGRGIKFSKSTYAEINARLPAQDSPRTVAAWIKRGETLGENYVIRHGTTFGIMQTDRHWRFVDDKGGLNSTAEPDNEWHHHCVTFEHPWIKYFIDGQLVGRAKRELSTKPGKLFLGNYDQNNVKHFEGMIDEFVFYDRALRISQIKTLFRLGKRGKHLPFETR